MRKLFESFKLLKTKKSYLSSFQYNKFTQQINKKKIKDEGK